MSALRTAWRRFWSGIRTLTGDDAYERYLAHLEARHPDEPALDRKAFYRSELDHRFRHASRCC